MKKEVLLVLALILFVACAPFKHKSTASIDLNKIEKERILIKADTLLNLIPITVTSTIASRSAGNMHDFYSEGDYWWPDSLNINGPYIRKDGLTNPDNFTAHRTAMLRFSQIIGALTSAYQITGNRDYASQTIPHLKAWFVNEDTRMNPNLQYAQAIKGVTAGRGIGIIDTVHLVEVSLAIGILEKDNVIDASDVIAIKNWFTEYNHWLTTHPFGLSEKNNGNNHSVTWALQVSAFAKVTNDTIQQQNMRNFFKQTLLPDQMALDGSFPKETSRTKAYGYSIFNLDAMCALAQILTTQNDNLFYYQTDNGLSLKNGIAFLHQYLKDKNTWPYPPDVMYWDAWPVAQPCLLFTGLHYDNQQYLELWKSLDRNFAIAEVVRNMPVKHPSLWF